MTLILQNWNVCLLLKYQSLTHIRVGLTLIKKVVKLSMSRVRTLKIYTRHRHRTWDYTTVPEIRLEGRWLEKLGFKEGDQVQVKKQQNKITITLCRE